MTTREKTAAWFDRVMYLSFLPLIFFLPIGKALVEIFATIIISCFFFKRIVDLLVFQPREQKRPVSNPFHFWLQRFLLTFKPAKSPLRAAVGLFIFTQLLSVLASQYPGLSWKGFFGKTVEATILFYSFIECFTTRRRLWTFLAAFVPSVFIVGVDGLFQRIFKFDFIAQHAFTPDHRVTACFSHPNDLGSYVAVTTVICLSVILGILFGGKGPDQGIRVPRVWQGIACGVAFFLATVVLGMTFSRGAWLGFLAGLAFLAVIDLKRSYWPILIGIIFLAVFYPLIGGVRNVTFVTDDIYQEKRLKAGREGNPEVHPYDAVKIKLEAEDTKYMLNNFTGTGRSVFWQEAFRIIKSSPVVGTGLNTYDAVAPRYMISWGQYPHNCYLQIAAETGIIGLAAFLWVMFVLSQTVISALRAMPLTFDRYLASGIFAGVLAFWVHGFLDTNFYSLNLGILMWIGMGWVVAVIQVEKKEI